MDTIGILPNSNGILCHIHWKPYFTYGCTHALCNAHHLRELERALEQDDHDWATQMKSLFEAINTAVPEAGGCLSSAEAKRYQSDYLAVLRSA